MLKTFFNNHKVSVILSVLCIILFVILNFEIQSKHKAQDQLAIATQNFKAVNDSIRVSAAKDKAIEYNKYSLIAKEASDLKGVNDSLLKKINNTKGDVKAAVDVTTVITDSGKLTPTKVVDNSTKDSSGVTHINKDVELQYVKYYSKGNYHKLITQIHVEGIPDSLQIGGDLISDQVSVNLFTGIKKNKDGNYEIFVRSDYPGLIVSDLNGALIDKKMFDSGKRRVVTFGFSVGYIPLLYNWTTKQTFIAGPNLGVMVGANFNISELLRHK